MNKKPLDFLRSMETEIPVSTIMVKDIITLHQDDTVFRALKLMAEKSISGLIIIDDKNLPIGILSEGDLIKKVFVKGKDPKETKIRDVMSSHLMTIAPEKSIGETSLLMKRHGISKLPVVSHNKLIGYVTKADLIERMVDMYRQNRRLMWLAALNAVQFIIIAILLISHFGKL